MSFGGQRNITVGLKMGGEWVNVTSDVLERQDIEVGRGYRGESDQAQPGSATLVLRNESGQYCLSNPLSPYYGLLGRNTPIVIGVDSDAAAYVPGTASANWRAAITAPDSVGLSVTGDLDVRIEVQAITENWTGASYKQLIGKWGSAPNNGWSFHVEPTTGKLKLVWTANGTTQLSATSTVAVAATLHQAFRVTLDVNNGAAGWTATFYTAATIAGPWVQLGAAVTTAGTTSIFDNTVTVNIGNHFVASATSVFVFAAEIRNGIGGTVVASPDFATNGVYEALTDAQGNVWTANEDTVTTTVEYTRPYIRIGNEAVRFVGEVSEWPTTWDVTSKDATVEIEAGDALRRLGSGSKPVVPAITTALLDATATGYTTRAYWKLEDLPGAQQGEPAIGSRGLQFVDATLFQPLTPYDLTSNFGQGDLRLGWVNPVVKLGKNDALFANVDMSYAAGGSNGFGVSFYFSSNDKTTLKVYVDCETNQRWTFVIDNTAATVTAIAPDGTSSLVIINPYGSAGIFVRLWLMQSGSNVSSSASFSSNQMGVSSSGPYLVTNSGSGVAFTGVTLQNPIAVTVAKDTTVDDGVVIGHLAVHEIANSHSTGDTTLDYAGAGNPTELATDRFIELCEQYAVDNDVIYGSPSDAPTQMGPLYAGELLDQLSSVAKTDDGLLYADRERARLIYRERSYNRAADLTVSYAAHNLTPPFRPVIDDRLTRNDITVTTPGGVSARAQLLTGALSVSEPPNGVGRYDDTVTANPGGTSTVDNLAPWLVFKGTLDRARYPELRINLASSDAPSDNSVRKVDVGWVIQVANADVVSLYDDVDLLVLGYTETINNFVHQITFNCISADFYKVIDLGVAATRRIASGSSSLNAAATSVATSLSVKTTDSSDLWTTGATSIPILVGGEAMTVTNITGATSPQTFTVTRSTNGVVKAQTADTVVKLARRATIAL